MVNEVSIARVRCGARNERMKIGVGWLGGSDEKFITYGLGEVCEMKG